MEQLIENQHDISKENSFLLPFLPLRWSSSQSFHPIYEYKKKKKSTALQDPSAAAG